MRLREVLAAILSALAVVLVVSGQGAPAFAAAVPPVIVSPAAGGTVVAGSTGPLVIDFPVAADKYFVKVNCRAGAYYWWTGGLVSYSGRQSITIDPLETYDGSLAGSTCQIDITGGTPYATTTSTFTVAAPPLALGEVSASAATFYPLVKDNYLDETEFRATVNRNTDATLTITDSDGKPVYVKGGLLGEGAGDYTWLWGGKTTSGKPVKPGDYLATISATADGVTLTKSTTVRVATKTVTRRLTLRKEAYQANETTRGNCMTDYDSDYGTRLDCWGGTLARTTYNFKIPANANNLRWGARTSPSGGDVCCRGTITKRGIRTAETKFQVYVQVTGWRATYTEAAWLSYKARVQI